MSSETMSSETTTSLEETTRAGGGDGDGAWAVLRRDGRVGDVDGAPRFGTVREPERVVKFRASRREPIAR